MNFLTGKQESSAVRQLKSLLFEEGVHVLSSFELNQLASLTYGELVCDEIFEVIEQVVAQPMNFTPLTIQKTLVVTKHVLIFGAEKCVNSAYGIGKFIESLQDFNTVLMLQQQQGPLAMLQRIQGGGVDKGGPVREAAQQVHKLLSNVHELRRIRNANADPNSLVPVGDDKAVFVTDEVRHYMLQKRLEEQRRIQIKSNLAKSAGGYGGGYNSKDGKSVVGAAHGIEEMLKMATKDKQKYSDDGLANGHTEDEAILAELAASAAAAKNDILSAANPTKEQAPAPEVDLLDFGGGSATSGALPDASSTGGHDLLGIMGSTGSSNTSNLQQSTDLLGLSGSHGHAAILNAGTADLLGTASTSSTLNPSPPVDPFGLAPSETKLESSSSMPLKSTPAVDPFGFAPSKTKLESSCSVPSIEVSSAIDTNVGTRESSVEGLTSSIGISSTIPSIGISSAVDTMVGTAKSSLDGVTSMVSAMTVSNGNKTQNKNSIMSSNEDRFAALDALGSTNIKAAGSLLSAVGTDNKIMDFTGMASNVKTAGSILSAMDTGKNVMNFTGVSSLADIAVPLSVNGGTGNTTTATDKSSGMSILGGLVAPSSAAPAPAPPRAYMGASEPLALSTPGSGMVSQTYGGSSGVADDNPFVMGGAAGSGLDPLAPPPCAAPPPPPPPPSS